MRKRTIGHGWHGARQFAHAFAFVVLTVPAAQAATASSLQQQLGSALAFLPHPHAVAGVSVLDLTGGASVYDKHADMPLVPASNMKVFIMAAALAELGADFVFETVLATDGTNLFMIGDGDPGLGDEKLHRARGESITSPFERWGDTLRAHNMLNLRGDIVIDESIFDEQWTHPDWEKDDLGTWYAAPVGGLNFNDNCLDITVSPGARPGAPAIISVQPTSSMINIVNHCRTGGKGKPALHHPAGTLDYQVEGCCAKRWTFGAVAFSDPGLLAAETLRAVLRQKGITIQGNIRRGRVRQSDGKLPPTLLVVGVHRTPLADNLRRVGKDSQNLFAECLLKRVGYAWARRNGWDDPRGSWELGARAVADVLRRAGIDPTGMVVADGSGLSRRNLCTARQLTAVLAWMYRQPGARLFRDSLAEAGVDGSLRKRLKNLRSSVHAKTGTMRGIRTLSGYVDSGTGTWFAFAVLFNGYPGSSAPYKDLQDRVCRILAAAG